MTSDATPGRGSMARIPPDIVRILLVIVLPAVLVGLATSRSIGIVYAVVAAVGLGIGRADAPDAAERSDGVERSDSSPVSVPGPGP